MMLLERNCKKLLLTALLVGAVSTAFAIEPPYGDNLGYEMDGSTLVLTSSDLTLPATIYSQAFKDRTDITDIVFPNNLTEISTSAFQGCTGLTEIVIPSSVTNIGGYAFYGCSSLALVTCGPVTPPTLGTDAFTGCAASLRICVVDDDSYSLYKNADNWKFYSITKCSETPTAVDNTHVDAAATKIIESNQLIILRNNEKYDVTGKKL